MDEKKLDLSNINQIDLEASEADIDDGESFGNISVDSVCSDDRELSGKTGIIIDFRDLEEEAEYIEHVSPSITAQFGDDAMRFNFPMHGDEDFSGYNQIDMECSITEDDDDFYGYPSSEKKYDFGDEEEDFSEKELIDEDIIQESKKNANDQISQGKVEDDYYEKLKKKHSDTNKKGAYNTHFHFAGNPKLEMDDFNEMNTPTGPIPNAITAPSVGSGDSNMTVAAQGMGMAESYRKLFEDLLMITGFELADCGKGKCCLKDKYSNQEDKICTTINDVEAFLAPYIEDCFIIPLQVEAGKDFKTCKEWVDWYTPEIKKAHPEYERDIQYCDLCANHLPECKLF